MIDEFDDLGSRYRQSEFREEVLGRPAVFLLPSDLMGIKVEGDLSCRHVVEEFLSNRYGGYTDEGSSHNGYWRNSDGKDYTGKYQKYRVSFLGKERIPELKKFLAYIAAALKEESIYLETGEDALLIFPDLSDGGTFK